MTKKILALLLVATIAVGLLAGCGKAVSVDDVKADPMTFIEEGLKKSLSKSPIGDLVSLKDPEATSVNVEITPTEDEGHIKFNATFDIDKLVALLDLDVLIEGEGVNGSLFVDKENLAVKSEMLKDIFDTDAVGISLKDFAKTVKESTWYDLLVVQTGMESELESELGDIDLNGLVESYVQFLKDAKKLSEESIKFDVTEEEITINDKKINAIKIIQTPADDVGEKLEKLISDYAKELENFIETDEDVTEQLKAVLDNVKYDATVTYFLSAKSGALLEIRSVTSATISEELAGAEAKSSVNTTITFGSKPESTFEPKINVEIVSGDVKMTVVGTSTIDKSAKTFKFTTNFKTEYPEEYGIEAETISTSIILDKEGNYKLIAFVDDKEQSCEGTFKVDGSKLAFTVKVPDGEETINLKIDVDFNAKTPVKFEYEDLMTWDENKIKAFVEKLQ